MATTQRRLELDSEGFLWLLWDEDEATTHTEYLGRVESAGSRVPVGLADEHDRLRREWEQEAVEGREAYEDEATYHWNRR